MDTADEEDPPTPPPVKWPKQDMFTNSMPYEDKNGWSVFESQQQLQQALDKIALQQFHGNQFNGLKWIQKHPKKCKWMNDTCTLYYCMYHYNSKCDWCLAVIQDSEGKSRIFLPSLDCVQHSNHDITYQKHGIPKQANAMIQSPSQLKQLPKHFTRRAREKGITVDTKMATKMARMSQRMRKYHMMQHLTGDGSSWGEAVQQMELLKRENIANPANFNEHTCYMLASRINYETKEFLGVASTENLLLNAYWQMQSGQDLTFRIDTSYWYTREQIGLMPIKVISLNQEGHTVAYGIVASEDEDAHDFILVSVHAKVEKVVNSQQFQVVTLMSREIMFFTKSHIL